ncbi:hypothetical protein BH23ACT9_BH23ACT9_32140 [soil metagenome]
MTEPSATSPHDQHVPTSLARQLRDAGLAWRPADGDRFVIPDRNLDDPVFMVSEMVVEVRDTPAGTVMQFNGTTEWALDSVMQNEVIWLPRETQLRQAIGPAFIALQATDGGLSCVVDLDGASVAHEGVSATEAYGRALLHLLLHG